MNSQDNNALVRRYLKGDLDSAELDAFEEQLLGDPDLLEMVETDFALAGALQAALPETSVRGRIAGHSPVKTAWQLPTAIAASFLLGVIGAGLLSSPDPEVSTVDQLVYVSPVRSSTAGKITLAADQTSLLSIDALSFEAAGKADLTLGNQTGVLFELEARPVSNDLSINVLLPALEPGTYQLRLSSTNHSEIYELVVE